MDDAQPVPPESTDGLAPKPPVSQETVLKEREIAIRAREVSLTARFQALSFVSAILGACLAFLATAYVNQQQAKANIAVERQKLEGNLILAFMSDKDATDRKNNLVFMNRAGYIRLPADLLKDIESNVQTVPRVEAPIVPSVNQIVSFGTFDPGCALPFVGVPNPPADDYCGMEGGSSDPAKQEESRAKNNFCASTQSPRTITYEELVSLQSQSASIPKNLLDRTVVRNLGEGQYVSYVAFIKNAHYSDVARGEAVNCNMPGRATNDIHIVLLKDPNDDECLSTTAEMSPHYRPSDWTDKNLMKASAGHPVRLRGHLFFDGSHTACSETTRPNPKRASLWEIHPVYSVDICTETTIAACQKPTAKWTPLSQSVSSE